MSVDLPAVHARAMQSARKAVAGIGDDQWGDMSDCDPWTVRDLVNHVVSGNFWVPELVGEGKSIEAVGDRLDGDVLGDDPLAAFDASAAAADATFSAPGAMDEPAAVSYGPLPASIYCGHRFMDLLIHGWDIAVSTGQDTTLDPELVDACLEVLEPQKAELLASGAFGHVIEVPADAPPQTQLLAVLGRKG